MQVVFNPKDQNTFASACLDRTIKVWSLNSPVPNYTLDGHTKGVNCLDYYPGNDRPYLISGADDKTVKVWDYQNKTCVQTLEAHTENVTATVFHPDLPIIISAAEDREKSKLQTFLRVRPEQTSHLVIFFIETIRIWHASTYRLENTLNYGLDRAWAIACRSGTNAVALGYDSGAIVIKVLYRREAFTGTGYEADS